VMRAEFRVEITDDSDAYGFVAHAIDCTRGIVRTVSNATNVS
jgi:hypothetical protein